MQLLADVGGTYTRCALADETGFAGPVTKLVNDEHADLAQALAAFLAAAGKPDLDAAALAIAAPVTEDDTVRLLNRDWQFSRKTLQLDLGVGILHVVNDFTAVALSLPLLEAHDLLAIGGGVPAPGAARCVLGPGTGLGVSGIVPGADGWVAISGEGGHVTLPAFDDEEAAAIARQRELTAHVSAERFLCGPGLLTLHRALVAGAGAPEQPVAAPADVARLARQGDALARRTLSLFFRMLGTVAADLALTLGARGGVYLAGGILPQLREELLASQFRARFESKGRHSTYLSRIPTWLITAADPALLGLRGLASRGPASR